MPRSELSRAALALLILALQKEDEQGDAEDEIDPFAEKELRVVNRVLPSP